MKLLSVKTKKKKKNVIRNLSFKLQTNTCIHPTKMVVFGVGKLSTETLKIVSYNFFNDIFVISQLKIHDLPAKNSS